MILMAANNASTTLGAALTTGATTIVVVNGAAFPSPGLNQYFTLTLNDVATGLLYEVCYCTARTGNSLTVLRAQEGTSALTWALGDYAYNSDTEATILAGLSFSSGNNPVLPFTIPASHRGVVQYCGATGTITIPPVATIPDGFLCPIVCNSTTATITVNTNSATVALPGGDVTGSFTITGYQSGVTLQWNLSASKWNSVASPGVTLGQVLNTYPVGNSTTATTNSISSTTRTLTAPSNGYAMVYGYTSIDPLAENLITATLSASLAGYVQLTADFNGNLDSQWGYLPMSAGQSSTFTMVGTQTNPTLMTASVLAWFVPLP